MRTRSFATGSALVLVAGDALAAESASFRLDGVVDAAGGQSASANHVVSACIGSEIAGTQSSASHRIDSGCGAVVFAPGGAGPEGDGATPVPVFDGPGLAILIVAMVAAGAAAVRRRRGPPRP